LFKQFSYFALIGGLATCIQYVLLIALVRGEGMAPTLASAIGFVISAVFNYLCNYYYTFRSNQRHAVAGLKFMVLAGIGLILNSVIMQVLVGAGLNYVLAQLFATTVVLLWNFFGNSLWTFNA